MEETLEGQNFLGVNRMHPSPQKLRYLCWDGWTEEWTEELMNKQTQADKRVYMCVYECFMLLFCGGKMIQH